ncbi:MAG: hypothetical protein IH818_14345 [Acidobacteria bacterium]|nr:hypothetical protein [Acidobacteriota bacterium]
MVLNDLVNRATSAIAFAFLLVAMTSCSSQGPTIEISDGSWLAEPATSSQSGDFRITVTHTGSEQEEYVVVRIFDGDPDSLPVVDGVLDIARSGISADPESPGVALFGIEYPEGPSGEGGTGFEPATIEPGETQSVTIGSSLKGGGGPGTYVVLSYLPGHYEQGEYAVFTLTDTSS